DGFAPRGPLMGRWRPLRLTSLGQRGRFSQKQWLCGSSREDTDMAIGPDPKAAFVAFHRFSFGARGGAYAGDLARAASDPRGFLKAELLQPAIAHLDTPTLAQTKGALTTVFAYRAQMKQEREARAAAAKRDGEAGKPTGAEPSMVAAAPATAPGG